MTTSRNPWRYLAAASLAIGLVAAACGSSSSTLSPLATGNGNGGAAGTGSTLTSGLSSNLDQLDSYQFTWSLAGSSTGAVATGAKDSLTVSGTIINKPAKAAQVNNMGMQYIAIGSQAWVSTDGNTWTATSPTIIDVTTLLPSRNYVTWFDTNSTDFSIVGNETKNGVLCAHFRGNSSLGNLSGLTGVSAGFQAELWVAKNGNYPVSGVYGFSGSAAGQAGSYGYSFDITHINDSANKITAPTNVISIPT